MKNIKLLWIFLWLPFFLEAVSKNEQYWEEQAFKKIPKALGFHADLAYSSYLIELHSSEMSSAIDYSIVEATVGLSYLDDRWLVGVYGKFVVDEVQSSMYIVTTEAPLNNHAQIDKDEFALYVNYTFLETQKDLWGFNTIYRYVNLSTADDYTSFFKYVSYLQYQTDGLGFSLAYQRKVFEKSMFIGQVGILYSQANVSMSESIDGNSQDSFVADSVNTFGFKVSCAYKYEYSEYLSFHVRADLWKQKFNSLMVTSRVGDTLPSASLQEESYSTYFGMAWRF